ncbi:intraflagellar transport protein 88 homolog isoform X9 [Sagmatias obliquidens]|uniref:Intraflagellar transport protein 88 homolog n=1 Tax=Tursiops truncatus TaxID=9739 RepID=A0A2U4BH24_TURTR|nr:intraflagellar transport protein 88 homolog isoform X9 [Tursiops truncatus]XP_026972537.1 intraflagellar transport protein 88 homolog isoform X9 [Lagenorhynchus obliquidens]XP_030738589.1 intraflagellar transport protein 88 homolog isoform X9 [Globicephala melas]
MMENVHLAPETDEDDLYSGYNDYNPTYDTEELENDTAFQQAVKTSHGRRPPITAKIPSTAVARPVATGCGSKTSLASSMGRPMTGAIQDGVTRPMTAVRAAGFTKAALRGSAFDPLGQSRGPAPPLEARNEDSPEEKIRQLEKKVNELVEESCIANSCGDLKLALEKAKDAGRKERVLVRQREQVTSPENINLDLTYSVLFNLASQYSANEMYPEALNTYQVIVKNKMFSNAGRLKVNMGNIYLKQRNYSKAIKFYRMALDQIPSVHKEMRIKIMQNIGVTFIKTGQYSDAINSFEHIMSVAPNLKAGFNLILSYFAVGDREKMKKAFQKLIAVPLETDEDGKYISPNDDPHTNLVIEAIKNDHLRQMERERKAMAEKYIMTAAKLIAPVIETSFAVGYDWCVEVVKASQYVELANDLEINKAIMYLRQKDFNQSYRYFPSNIEVIEWLGAYYIDTQFCEKAIQYFERASLIQPTQVKWQLMVASCFRRSGNYQKALDTYKDIHRKFPENVECLRFLVRLCTDIGLKEVQEYATKLKRLEKMKEIREQRTKSGRDGSGGPRGRRDGSAGSDGGQNCGAGSRGERLSAQLRALPRTEEPYDSSSNKELDASYVDPLGPQIERPRTAAKKRVDEDDFADEELGDDLLPE